jgi:hypothetical protein
MTVIVVYHLSSVSYKPMILRVFYKLADRLRLIMEASDSFSIAYTSFVTYGSIIH